MDKWIAICAVGVMGVLFAPVIMMEHSKANCRIEAIKAGVDADKINMACGVK
jgi:hypothetical protein